MRPAIIEQVKQSKFICSACGSARDRDCAAPALERLAEIKEQARQRQIKKREQKQEPRHVTNDAAASAEARKAAYAAKEEEEVLTPEEERRRHALFQEHLGEVLAEHDKAVPEEPDKTEEWVSPIEDRDGKWVILYRTVFGTFDSEEAAEGWAMTHYPAARRWAQQLEASEADPPAKKGGRPTGSKNKPKEATPPEAIPGNSVDIDAGTEEARGEETISPPTIPDDGLDLRGTFLDRRNEASPEGAA